MRARKTEGQTNNKQTRQDNVDTNKYGHGKICKEKKI